MDRRTRNPENVYSRRDFLSAAIGGAAALPLASRPARAQRSRPNFVIIVLDTARRDHLSCYGYARDTSPFLRELAHESRVYQNAYSTSCWTVPAHASLFTGLYPTSHASTWENYRLDSRLTTFAEVLQRDGYRTIGICENSIVSAKLGFGKGFQSFRYSSQYPQNPQNPVASRFREAVSQALGQPFLIFVNLVGPHDPYGSSGPFLKAYLSDPAHANSVCTDVLGVIARGKPLNPVWLKHLTEHYDAELRNCDYLVESFADSLKQTKQWDNAVFIVLADHGENLGDHGFVNHQFCLYESLIRIPLIVRFPGSFPPGSQEALCVQITDIFPTLLDLAGIDTNEHPSQGISLLPGCPRPDRLVVTEYALHARFRNPHPGDKRWTLARVQKFKRRLKSIRTGAMKLIRGDDGSEQLFNLATDPDELNDLSAIPTSAAARDYLTRRLNAFVTQCLTEHPSPVIQAGTLSEDAEETLKAMGYL